MLLEQHLLPTFGSNESIKAGNNQQISGSNWIQVPMLKNLPS